MFSALVIAYACLLVALLASKSFLRTPVFTLYVVAILVKALFLGDRNEVELRFLTEPFIAGLKVLMALEAFALLTESLRRQHRFWILALVGSVGVVFTVLVRGFHAGREPIDWYIAMRQQLHVFLAAGALSFLLYAWVYPSGRVEPRLRWHGVIVMCYLLTHAIVGLIPYPKTGPEGALAWELIHRGFLAAKVGCISLWLLKGLAFPLFPQRRLDPVETL